MMKTLSSLLLIFFTPFIMYGNVASASTAMDNAPANTIAYNKMLDGFDYPFPVKKYAFESQNIDLEMAYMYLPPRNADMGVITLLHGKNFNGAYWEQTANLLHEMGYGVLIPDQIGFGKSSKPLDYQYSFEALAHNTKGLMDHLNIKSTQIMAHSMGGMLGSRFALMYPKNTSKLILVNPIGLENYLHYVEYKDIAFFEKNELGATASGIINYQKKNYYDGDWNAQYESLAAPLIGWVNGPDWPHMAKISARTYDMIFTGPVIEEFDDFQMPVTLIIGTRDRTGPGRNWKKPDVKYELGRYDTLGKKITKRNPSINVIEMDGIGHLPHIENFDAFRAIIEKTFHQ